MIFIKNFNFVYSKFNSFFKLNSFNLFYIIFIFVSVILFIFFPDNFSNTYNDNDFLLPTYLDTYHLSSEFGYREIYGKVNYHNGIDFPVPENAPVYATMSGIVNYSDFMPGYGICVTIIHENGLKTLYGHLSEKYHVPNGSYVFKGDLIAYVGPKFLSDGRLNGFTTGPHLHFSIFDNNGNALSPLDFEYKKAGT